jgi:protein CpxP
MKCNIHRPVYFITVFVAAVLFCMTAVFADTLTAQAQSASAGKSGKSKVERTEDKIKDYRAKLKITDAQEEQWSKLAAVMRDNAVRMEALIEERMAKGNALNAVEDLKAYSRITDEHAAGLKNFIAAFEPLYESMSPEQKKNADTIFTGHGQRKGQKRK